MAEFLGIPRPALPGTQPQSLPTANVDPNAAPRQLNPARAPSFSAEPLDSRLRLLNKCYTTMRLAPYYSTTRLRIAGLLLDPFSEQELIDAAPMLGCELKERSIHVSSD